MALFHGMDDAWRQGMDEHFQCQRFWLNRAHDRTTANAKGVDAIAGLVEVARLRRLFKA